MLRCSSSSTSSMSLRRVGRSGCNKISDVICSGYSTSSNNTASPQLVRDYIHSQLYKPKDGYFTSRQVVHSPDTPIQFDNLWGKWEYQSTVAELYKKEREAWMTPVEIFAPWYSNAIASYILETYRKTQSKTPLAIYEIGGGSGANALHILNYIKEIAPPIYKQMSYTLVEISSTLAARQTTRLSSHIKKTNVKVLCQDFLQWGNDKNYNRPPAESFVIALEVLDNLPHDKVTLDDGTWYESVVNSKNCSVVEEKRPLSDPLVRRALQLFSPKLPLHANYRYSSLNWLRKRLWGSQTLTSAFLPTGSLQFLDVLKKNFPRHRLVAADFDFLPSPVIKNSKNKVMNHPKSLTSLASGPLSAYNAPIVASKVDGVTTDHDTYLLEDAKNDVEKQHTADIFFATDFNKLRDAYAITMNENKKSLYHPKVLKSSEFLEKYASVNQTKTILGYNPLLQDYTNTSFLLT